MPKLKEKIPLSRPDPKPTPPPPAPEAAPTSPPAQPEAPKAEATPPGTVESETSSQGVGLEQFMHSMFNEPVPVPAVPEPPKDQNASEGQPEAKEVVPTEAAPASEPEKKAKKEATHESNTQERDKDDDEEPEIDLDAIGRTVREAVSSVTKSAEPAKPADAKPEQPQLSPSRRDTLETAKFMEESMDEYRGSGLQGQLQRYWQTEDAYKGAWIKANIGNRYRSDDEEHNDFYASNPMPDYSPDDFSDAQTLRRQKLDDDRESRHQQEINRIKFETESKNHEREIKETGSKAAADLYVNAPDNVKAALTVDGKVVVNEETLAKLELEEPVYAERLKFHGQVVDTMVQELERLTRFPEHVRYDPSNPVHRDIMSFADNLERAMLSRPKAETMRDGKSLLSQQDYMERAEAIRSSNAHTIPQKKQQLKALSDKHYFADSEIIQQGLIRSASHRAKQEAEEIEARLNKSSKYSGRSNAASANGSHTTAPAPAVKTTDGRDVRPPSPTVTSSERTNAGGADPKNIADRDAAIDRAMWT